MAHTPDDSDPDLPLTPALLRGLTQPRLSQHPAMLSRRNFLLATAGLAGTAAFGLPGVAQAAWAKRSPAQWADWWKAQKPSKELVFANWPLYIDVTKAGKHPTLEMFTKETGIAVKYLEPIQSNPEFFAKISPLLKAGEPIGYDIAVMTNDSFQFTELLQQGWAIPLWKEKLPNVWKNADPAILNPVYDPHNTYTTVWQSGFTGIGYNPKLTKREITSVEDLWDPAFKGHVGMFKNPTQYGDFGLLKLGIDPAKATVADWERAAKVLLQQRRDGLVRVAAGEGEMADGLGVHDSSSWVKVMVRTPASNRAEETSASRREAGRGMLRWTPPTRRARSWPARVSVRSSRVACGSGRVRTPPAFVLAHASRRVGRTPKASLPSRPASRATCSGPSMSLANRGIRVRGTWPKAASRSARWAAWASIHAPKNPSPTSAG